MEMWIARVAAPLTKSQEMLNQEVVCLDFKLDVSIRTIVIGDIHGCFYTLMNILDEIKFDKSKDKIIFLGDYVDRGKYSYEVLEFLVSLKRTMKDRCVCLMGNHEDIMIESITNNDRELWKLNGGGKTIRSYYKNDAPLMKHINWLKSLPLIHKTDDYVFCHAGLPETKISDNTRYDILWSRDWVYNKTDPNEKTVICGHTVVPDGHAGKTKNGNILIDTGCGHGMNLCALVITDEIYPVYVKQDERD